MDDHNEKIANNKIGEGNDKVPNARNHNYESTTVNRKENDPVFLQRISRGTTGNTCKSVSLLIKYAFNAKIKSILRQ